MEINEQALLEMFDSHLEVTETLLEHYLKFAKAALLRPEIAADLPALPQRPTLEELQSSMHLLRRRVRAILDRK